MGSNIVEPTDVPIVPSVLVRQLVFDGSDFRSVERVTNKYFDSEKWKPGQPLKCE